MSHANIRNETETQPVNNHSSMHIGTNVIQAPRFPTLLLILPPTMILLIAGLVKLADYAGVVMASHGTDDAGNAITFLFGTILILGTLAEGIAVILAVHSLYKFPAARTPVNFLVLFFGLATTSTFFVVMGYT